MHGGRLRHADGTDGLLRGGIDSYLDLWEIEKEMNAVIVALITGGLSLIGVIITNVTSNRKIEHQLEVHQAVTETKLESLTDEVRKHNNFAARIPFIENDIAYLKHEVEEFKKK